MAKKSVLKALLKYAPKSVEGLIESAIYADGHAVIANKFEEGGNMRLDFDIKQIAPPNPEMQETMNWINRAGDQSERKAEPVPASRGNARESAQAENDVRPPQQTVAAATQTPPPQPAGNGTKRMGSALFPADEAQDLDGVEPPNFR
jgi:hypothetical protein